MKKIFGIALFVSLFFTINNSAFSFTRGHAKSEGQDCCKAESVLGAKCMVCLSSCPSGTTIYCEGGFFGADCYCKIIEDNWNFPEFTLPDIPTPEQETHIDNYKSFLMSLGSPGISSLLSSIENILLAVQNQNSTDYNFYEQEYITNFENLSEQVQEDINNWIENNPAP